MCIELALCVEVSTQPNLFYSVGPCFPSLGRLLHLILIIDATQNQGTPGPGSDQAR